MSSVPAGMRFNSSPTVVKARCLCGLLCAAGLLFGSGCRQTGVASPHLSACLSDSPQSIAAYLDDEPAIRSVQVWHSEEGQGLVVRTDHYVLYTTLLEPLMLRQIPAFLEAACSACQSQLPQPLSISRPMEVYLFSSRSQWEQFTHRFAGSDAAIYLRIQRGAYTLRGVIAAYNIGRKQTFSVLGHEVWHQFNQQTFAYRLPSWLDEGIAALFETCRYTQGRFVFEPQYNLMRLGALKETVQRSSLISLPSLIILNPGQVLDSSNDAVAAFYAQNYALVRFLREYNYGIYLRRYHALLFGAVDGTWPLPPEAAALAADRLRPLTVGWNMQVSPALFNFYIGDVSTLDADYKDFCRKIVYAVRLKD